MNFEDYQKKAAKTIQEYAEDKENSKVVPFLGLMGEAGSVIAELKKKLRDGKAYTNFENKLKEELGDVLWYISTIATQNDLKLESIATDNIRKIKDRFDNDSTENFVIFDEDFPEKEQFPREFEIKFIVLENDGKQKVRIMNAESGEQLGDDITDNSHEEDGYRFHDIFHFGFVAYLGWSPVVRKLMGIKRKSDNKIDEIEDGARATITEELVSLYIYNHSLDHELFKYSKSVDSEVLKIVQKLVSGIEVRDCTQKQWERAIINSYKIYNELRENNGGRVLVSIKNNRLTYLGKN